MRSCPLFDLYPSSVWKTGFVSFLFFSLSVSLSPPRFQYLHGEGKIVRLFGKFLVGILKRNLTKLKCCILFVTMGYAFPCKCLRSFISKYLLHKIIITQNDMILSKALDFVTVFNLLLFVFARKMLRINFIRLSRVWNISNHVWGSPLVQRLKSFAQHFVF